jgi:hypothetical protein
MKAFRKNVASGGPRCSLLLQTHAQTGPLVGSVYYVPFLWALITRKDSPYFEKEIKRKKLAVCVYLLPHKMFDRAVA